jgi:uncharacterized repeat protein (TIGR01451 family)
MVLRRGISTDMRCKCWKSSGFWALLLTTIAAGPHVAAAAEDAADIQTELIAEVREPMSATPGREVYRFVPATILSQGEVVYYTLRITNPTAAFARNVTVVQPVPANTAYIADSAAGPAAIVTFSVDGGRTFAPANALTVNVEGLTQPAQPAQYTHIRWQLRNALAPGATALARFRATFR